MKAVFFEGPNKISLKDADYPNPNKKEVTIKVEYCGVCGTDRHIFQGDYFSEYPLIGGHEFSGTIVELGEGVDGWSLGDRVVVDPALYCGKCHFCRRKMFNQCSSVRGMGVALNGAFAEYINVPVNNLYRLPDSVTFEEAALMEPLACVIYGLERLKANLGERAIIFGAGFIGITLMQTLLLNGLSEVVMVDINQAKLDLAKKLGARKVFMNEGDLLDTLSAEGCYDQFDIVVDATGVKSVIENMFHFAGPGARILQFGVPSPKDTIKISPFDLYHKDWSYIGTMAASYTCEQALSLIEHCRLDLSALITRKVSLNEFVSYMSDHKPNQDCKVLVAPHI